MSYHYTIRTENETVYTNNIEIQDCYCWIQELQTLYRILEENSNLQPYAIVYKDNVRAYALCRVGKFENSQKAFETMAYNNTVLNESLKELDKIDEDIEANAENSEPKTYLACYMFNYFGGDKIDDKVIDGAGINVAFRPYKNGKLIQFFSEKDTYYEVIEPSRILTSGRKKTIYLTDAVTVSYDREDGYKLIIDTELVERICQHFGWDKLCIEVHDVCLYYMESNFISNVYECERDVFQQFLKEHADDFDISDNRIAQCPGYGWTEA